MRMFICIMCMLHATFAAPQFVTFDNGKVGVNFGGYHAEAGLGGLLTGNAAHGGLSASAGTPWGQQAAAGLGGGVGGRTAGVAYAGAQAIPAVGASAVLGGAAGGPGFAGSEAHANGHVAASSKTISTGVVQSHYVPSVTSAPAALPPTAVEHIDVIQRVKPPKKYTLIRNERVSNRHNAISATNKIGGSISTVAHRSDNDIAHDAAANSGDGGRHSITSSKTTNTNTNTKATTTAAAGRSATHAENTDVGNINGADNQAPATTLIIVNREHQRQRQIGQEQQQQQQQQDLRNCLRRRRQQWKCVPRTRQRGHQVQRTKITAAEQPLPHAAAPPPPPPPPPTQVLLNCGKPKQQWWPQHNPHWHS